MFVKNMPYREQFAIKRSRSRAINHREHREHRGFKSNKQNVILSEFREYMNCRHLRNVTDGIRTSTHKASLFFSFSVFSVVYSFFFRF